MGYSPSTGMLQGAQEYQFYLEFPDCCCASAGANSVQHGTKCFNGATPQKLSARPFCEQVLENSFLRGKCHSKAELFKFLVINLSNEAIACVLDSL